MRRSILLFLLFFAGACAPATTAGPRAPTPAVVRADPAPSPAPVAADEAAPSGAPASWWLAATDATGTWGAGVERAYRELLAGRQPARTVVVAVIDSGVDIEHDDLDDNLWVNEDEKPGNGIDDDGNGYIDDVHGWNFIGGRDGRHVDRDTYEVTRLFAKCRQRAEGGSPGDAPAPAQCTAIEADFEERVRESREQLAQLKNMNMMLTHFTRLLREATGSETLTVAKVRALQPMRADVQQARQVYLQLAEAGYSPEDIAKEQENMEQLVEFSLNPAFDPRPIVGDDYGNPEERVYGNADVTGPDASHGTGVAGIIAAERGNGIGEDGIAPAVQIMVVRAVPNGDERDKDVANAIRYAADNGAHIINMSFGKGWSPEKPVVDAAVRYAAGKGVLLVHASGNDGANLAEESNFPNPVFADGGRADTWIEVGASGWQGAGRLAAEFSNYGAGQVDVFAPGVDIRTTDVAEDWQTNSGTSFAAPVVSGVAALLMSYYPQLSAADVRRIILESATPLREQLVVRPGAKEQVRFGELSVTGAVVNAYEAVRMAEKLAAQKR
jgi:subtilisin family serine protease